MESLLVWTLTGVAVAMLLGRSRARASLLVAAVLVASTAAGHALWASHMRSRERSAEALRARVPEPVGDGGYVTSNACRACHPAEYATWHRSYHRSMTQVASASAVRAPFAGETLRSDDGKSYHLRRDGDELWVDISGVGARRITMMTGSHHMQAFWLPYDRGNAQIEFPFTYVFDDRALGAAARRLPRRTRVREGPVDVESHLHRVPRHARAAAASTRAPACRRAPPPSSASPARRATGRRRSTSPPTAARSAASRCTTATASMRRS